MGIYPETNADLLRPDCNDGLHSNLWRRLYITFGRKLRRNMIARDILCNTRTKESVEITSTMDAQAEYEKRHALDPAWELVTFYHNTLEDANKAFPDYFASDEKSRATKESPGDMDPKENGLNIETQPKAAVANTMSNDIKFIPMICPNCGGQLMISEKQEKAICSYCGIPFLLSQSTGSNHGQVENYLRLAKTALDLRKTDEAYDYYSKALELEPDNYLAWYGRACAKGWTIADDDFSPVEEARSYFDEAIENAPPELKTVIQQNAAVEIALMCCQSAPTIEGDPPYIMHSIEYIMSIFDDALEIITDVNGIADEDEIRAAFPNNFYDQGLYRTEKISSKILQGFFKRWQWFLYYGNVEPWSLSGNGLPLANYEPWRIEYWFKDQGKDFDLFIYLKKFKQLLKSPEEFEFAQREIETINHLDGIYQVWDNWAKTYPKVAHSLHRDIYDEKGMRIPKPKE